MAASPGYIPNEIEPSPQPHFRNVRKGPKLKTPEKTFTKHNCGADICRTINLVVCLLALICLIVGLSTPSWYSKPNSETLGLWQHEYINHSVIIRTAKMFDDETYHIFKYKFNDLKDWLALTAELLISAIIAGVLVMIGHALLPLVIVFSLFAGSLGLAAAAVFGDTIGSQVLENDTVYLSWSFHLVVLGSILYIVDGLMVLGWCLVEHTEAFKLPWRSYNILQIKSRSGRRRSCADGVEPIYVIDTATSEQYSPPTHRNIQADGYTGPFSDSQMISSRQPHYTDC